MIVLKSEYEKLKRIEKSLLDRIADLEEKSQRKTSQIKSLEAKLLFQRELINKDATMRKGFSIVKKNLKPFKSGEKIATVLGYCWHPTTERLCYIVDEQDCYVEAAECVEV